MDFVEVVYHDMQIEERAVDTLSILDSFAHPEPVGRQSLLIEALIQGYSQRPREVDSLVLVFRAGDSPSLSDVVRKVKPRLLASLLPNPLEFLAELQRARNNRQEWKDTLNVLEYLAAPGPHSKRADLISALAEAMIQRQNEVTALLQDRLLSSKDNLRLWFRLQVRFEFYVGRFLR